MKMFNTGTGTRFYLKNNLIKCAPKNILIVFCSIFFFSYFTFITWIRSTTYFTPIVSLLNYRYRYNCEGGKSLGF